MCVRVLYIHQSFRFKQPYMHLLKRLVFMIQGIDFIRRSDVYGVRMVNNIYIHTQVSCISFYVSNPMITFPVENLIIEL